MVASYVLSYSKTNKKENRGEFIGRENGVAYFSKEPMIAISLEFFNLTTCRAYTSIKELLKNPLSLEEEQKFRAKITHSFFDLTPIFIFESIPQNRCEIYLDAICFEDVRQL